MIHLQIEQFIIVLFSLFLGGVIFGAFIYHSALKNPSRKLNNESESSAEKLRKRLFKIHYGYDLEDEL
jgi:uncharacterized membrane protein YqgA involved in biofilm formation